VTSTGSSRYLPRHATKPILAALQDTRIVLVNGARQSGKTTLVRRVGRDTNAEWFSLDNAQTRDLATTDPTSFVRLHDRMVIDEIQRNPELLLSIKELVDEQPNPGRFLLTGSARVLGLRRLPDTLVGRMETIELWPLSQGEIDGAPDGFVDAAFELGAELHHDSDVSRSDYLDRILRGGFPDVLARTAARRSAYLKSYVTDLINRDVIQLSEIERGHEMRELVRMLAARSAQPIVAAGLGNELGISATTVQSYLTLLEEVFLIKRIPPWTRRISGRSVKQSKLAFVDSGIPSALLGMTSSRLAKPGAPLGGLVESFVAMEIARQLTWSQTQATLSHYRTRDGVEVDLVLENDLGQVIGIEVKASATPRSEDFRGLNHLANQVGDDFLAGFVLHLGDRTLPGGKKMRAVPISALWQLGD